MTEQESDPRELVQQFEELVRSTEKCSDQKEICTKGFSLLSDEVREDKSESGFYQAFRRVKKGETRSSWVIEAISQVLASYSTPPSSPSRPSSGGDESGLKHTGGDESGLKHTGGDESGLKHTGGDESGLKHTGGDESGLKHTGGDESGLKHTGGDESGLKRTPDQFSGRKGKSPPRMTNDTRVVRTPPPKKRVGKSSKKNLALVLPSTSKEAKGKEPIDSDLVEDEEGGKYSLKRIKSKYSIISKPTSDWRYELQVSEEFLNALETRAKSYRKYKYHRDTVQRPDVKGAVSPLFIVPSVGAQHDDSKRRSKRLKKIIKEDPFTLVVAEYSERQTYETLVENASNIFLAELPHHRKRYKSIRWTREMIVVSVLLPLLHGGLGEEILDYLGTIIMLDDDYEKILYHPSVVTPPSKKKDCLVLSLRDIGWWMREEIEKQDRPAMSLSPERNFKKSQSHWKACVQKKIIPGYADAIHAMEMCVAIRTEFLDPGMYLPEAFLHLDEDAWKTLNSKKSKKGEENNEYDRVFFVGEDKTFNKAINKKGEGRGKRKSGIYRMMWFVECGGESKAKTGSERGTHLLPETVFAEGKCLLEELGIEVPQPHGDGEGCSSDLG